MNVASLPLALYCGPLAQHKARVLLSLVAIALGVALGYAVQLVNHSAVQEFEQAVRSLAGDADFNVRADHGGLDEAWYARIARLPAVALASPVVEAEAKFIGQREPLPLLGLDVLRATQLAPELLGDDAIERLDTLRADTIFLSAAAAARLHVRRGDTVQVQSGASAHALCVAGVYGSGRTAWAWMDIAGAQTLLGRLGRLDRIDIRLRAGADAAILRAQLQRALPPGARVERPAETVQRNAALSRAYRVNLNVLALVALFTGALLVFSTQALGIVRRRAQLALLRVLGMTRRALVRMLLIEALLIGVLGALLGLLGGYAVALFVLRHVGADLGGGAFAGVAAAVHGDVWSALLFFAAGVGAALLGAFAPAIEAARATPAAALKAGDEQRSFARLHTTAPGLVLLALGGAATLLPPLDGLPIFGYLAIALLLIGTILLLPRVATFCFARLRLPTARAAPQLALAQLRSAPGQTMLSLAAIVASVSLFVSMAIMVSSFRVSFEHWLDRVLPADLYVRVAAGSDTAYLAPDDQARLRALPGLRRVEMRRDVPLLLDARHPPVQLLARPIDPDDPGRTLVLVAGGRAASAAQAPPVWVSEAVAEVYGYRVGAMLTLPLGGAQHTFTVAGIWRDYARQHGAIAMARAQYVALTGDRNASEAALWLDSAQQADALRAMILDTFGAGRVEVYSTGELRARSLRIFDRTFAVTWALEVVALLIGLAALSASFGALVLLRRREFGMLRHVGMTRRQIGAMLAGEGLLVSSLGLAVGVTLGWAISLVLVHVVNRQSFHWSMDLHLPVLTLCAFVALLLLLSALTALVSARYALSTDALRAVREDW